MGEHISLGIWVSGVGEHTSQGVLVLKSLFGEVTIKYVCMYVCVSQVWEHILLGICVSHVGEHISLEILVSQVGDDMSLGICVSQVEEHISPGIHVFQVEEHRFLFSVVELITITLIAFIIFKYKKWRLGF